MESIYRLRSSQVSQLIFHPLSRQSYTRKDQMNENAGSGFKTSDQVQGQGFPRIENGAYTVVREYFNLRDNTAIGP